MNRRLPVLALASTLLLAAPVAVAAAEPALTASVIPGQEIDIVGSGFPAEADVVLAIQRNGVDAGSQTLTTDATGAFSATIEAGPGRGGVYSLTATSGSATATVEALAVETAGAGGTGGLNPSAPPTDTAAGVPSRPASSKGVPALVAVFLVLLGAAALRRWGRLPSAG